MKLSGITDVILLVCPRHVVDCNLYAFPQAIKSKERNSLLERALRGCLRKLSILHSARYFPGLKGKPKHSLGGISIRSLYYRGG